MQHMQVHAHLQVIVGHAREQPVREPDALHMRPLCASLALDHHSAIVMCATAQAVNRALIPAATAVARAAAVAAAALAAGVECLVLGVVICVALARPWARTSAARAAAFAVSPLRAPW